MIDASLLFLNLTHQPPGWGLSGLKGVDLINYGNPDEVWFGPLCQTFSKVIYFDLYKRANAAGIGAVNREILEFARTYSPRYVFHLNALTPLVTIETLAELRGMGCIVVGVFFDDDVLFESHSRWMAPHLDYCVTNSPRRVSDYERIGARAAAAVPLVPVNPAIYRKLSLDKAYDGTFTGGLHHNRSDYLEQIGSHGTPVRTFGWRWPGMSGYMTLATMVRIFNQSRINLNFTGNTNASPAAHILNGRIFEVTACGGFLLTEHAPGIEACFEIGREIVCFESPSEAADKIRYFLAHENEREQIASKGHARCIADHAPLKVLGRIFQDIESDLTRRGRPPVPSETPPNLLQKVHADTYYRWAKAMLKQPPPLRNGWKETAELALRVDPGNQDAGRLIRNDRLWGDPEPIRGRLKAAGRFIRDFTRRIHRSASFRLGSAIQSTRASPPSKRS